MTGITIGIGRYAEMAEKAAQSFRDACCLPAIVMTSADAARYRVTDPFFLKFWMFDAVEDPEIVYFDADTVTVRDYLPSRLSGPAMVTVRDPYPDYSELESQMFGFNPRMYFNAGWFVANRAHHKELFDFCKVASRHLDKLKKAGNPAKSRFNTGIYDGNLLTDQAILNMAVQRLKVKIHFLDRRYNFLTWDLHGQCELLHEIFVAHLCGPDKQLIADLKIAAAVRPKFQIDNSGFKMFHGNWQLLHSDQQPQIITLREDGTIDNADFANFWFCTSSSTLIFTKWNFTALELNPAPGNQLWTNSYFSLQRI